MTSKWESWILQRPGWVLPISLLLALVIRLLGIGSRPTWYDEAFAVLFAEKGPAAMLVGTLAPAGGGASDVHPLGYYTILWAWMRMFGESLVSVRALSIAASLGALAVIFLLAHGLFGARTALVAGLIAAFSPFQVHYGQEVRMYAFLGLWLALATYCYWRASRSSGWPWWLGFAAFAALAQYTHNLAAAYLLAIALWPVIRGDWRLVVKVLLAGSLSLTLYIPWLVHLPAQFAKVSQAYWIARPEPHRLLTLLLTYVTNLPLEPWQLGLGIFAALSIAVVALLETLRAARTHDPQAPDGLWILYLAFAPPLLVFIFSQWRPIYVERGFLPSGSAFCVCIAWVLARAGTRRSLSAVLIVLLGIGFSIGIFQHLEYAGFPYGPYAAIAQSVRSGLQPGDVILHSNKLSFLPMVYFDRTLPETYIADPPGSSVDTLAPSTQKVLGLEAADDIASAVGNSDRVWFIIFEQSDQEYIRAGYDHHPHIQWLMEHFTQSGVQRWGDLDVYLFTRPTSAASARFAILRNISSSGSCRLATLLQLPCPQAPVHS